jgi:RNA recognition motif-containing protein
MLNRKYIDGKRFRAGQVKVNEGKNSVECLSEIEKDRQECPRPSFSAVYVTNLDAIINEELLRMKFSVYGTVICVRIIRDENHGHSKGTILIVVYQIVYHVLS